ncbi:MAG TPA: PEP-CTERM sorting domain-containing protein [Pseudoduganella sp.]
MSTQSPYTVNSIHFSYMNYSQPPASYFSRRPQPFRGLPPPLPAEPPASAPGPALPPVQQGQTGTPPLIEPPVQSPVVVVPEPGTVALLILGLMLLARTVKKADDAK